MTEHDLSGLRAYVESLSGSFEALQKNLGRLQVEIRDVRGRATSPDGYVKVEVGPRGQLTGLQLDPRIYRSPDSRALARTITDTAQRASADAARQVTDLCERYAPGMDAAKLVQGERNPRSPARDTLENLLARWETR